ncbi:Putative transposase [Nannocystis exedens]|uniref:Putative transposase n=1 Tax=Nannocystis exedens TaxID=54 RepID=A0A1I1VVV4_9BACT|nr:putative transposase [Nannocystis exedens]SFD87236.1 Putative transposase [Nannocystis exedens]
MVTAPTHSVGPASEAVTPARRDDVDGRDRKQLERVCRYLLRPPFAHDAVKALPDGRVRVLIKAPWRSGAAHADMPPDKFLARLCALVPRPVARSGAPRTDEHRALDSRRRGSTSRR